MKITLSTPFNVGDLNPDVSYPHAYITTFYVNGPAQAASITYEVGTLQDPSDAAPMGVWQKAPEVPSFDLRLTGAELYPFFVSRVDASANADPSLWDQVEKLLYSLIQRDNARMGGEIG